MYSSNIFLFFQLDFVTWHHISRFFWDIKTRLCKLCITHRKMFLYCNLNGFCSICYFYSNGFVFCLQVQPGVNIESGLCSWPASSTPLIPAETILPPPSTHVRVLSHLVRLPGPNPSSIAPPYPCPRWTAFMLFYLGPNRSSFASSSQQLFIPLLSKGGAGEGGKMHNIALCAIFKLLIKSNLFIVTHHVHKCTDGEILRYKTLCHGSTSNKIWNIYNIQTTMYTLYTIYTFTQ